MFCIEIQETAYKNLKKLDKQHAIKILKTIKKLENFPDITNIKKLKNFTPTHRLRVGDYRVLFGVDIENNIIKIGEVKHRKESYK